MTVALPSVAMRWSELVTIYLAAAAPFGVSFYLRRAARDTIDFRALARSTGAAMLWPLTVFRYLLDRDYLAARLAFERGDESFARRARMVEEAKRALVNSLRELEDLLAGVRACEVGGRSHEEGHLAPEAEHHALFSARESVERYAGLALAAEGVSADARPTARELELCRLAGRTGDDLLLAGRCIHRRNVTRLLAHRERARAEMVEALAALRELTARAPAAPRRDGQRGPRLSEAVQQTFSRAINLLTLLDERQAAEQLARLLDAECARRRLLAADERLLKTNGSEAAPGEGATGGEPCTTPAATTASVTRRPHMTSRLAGG